MFRAQENKTRFDSSAEGVDGSASSHAKAARFPAFWINAALLKKSPFVRNVAVVAGGTAAAQAVTIAISPVVTRLYGPDSFGVLGVFNSLLTTLTPLACFGYFTAIVIPRSDHDAYGLVRLSVTVAVLFSTVIAVLLLFTRTRLASALGFGISGWYLLMLPVAVIAAAIAETLSQWLIRVERFRALATVSISHSSLSAGAKISLGLFWPSGIALIAVTTATNIYKALLSAMLAHRSLRACRLSEQQNGNRQRLKRTAGEYVDFPLFELPREFANRFGEAAPTVILAALFGPALFALVFGSEWYIAGQVARWLSLWYFIHVAVHPAAQGLMVTQHLPFNLVWAVDSVGGRRKRSQDRGARRRGPGDSRPAAERSGLGGFINRCGHRARSCRTQKDPHLFGIVVMNIDTVAYSLKHRLPALFAALQRSTDGLTSLRHRSARDEALSRAVIDGTVDGAQARIRPLTTADAGALHRFLAGMPQSHLRFFRPHDFSQTGIERTIGSKTHCCYGLFLSHRLSGYALIKLFPTIHAYCGLIVSPGSVGHGLGKFLWRYLIWQCVLMDVVPCATVQAENTSSWRSLRSIKPGIVQSPLAGDYVRLVIPVSESDRVCPELSL